MIVVVGMLPGDELVADYLARAGRVAADALAPADSAVVVEEIGRRVRARVGAPPRWDLRGTQHQLAELGEPEDLVEAVAAELIPGHAKAPEPEPVVELEIEPDTDFPTLDLGAVPPPVPPPVPRLPLQADRSAQSAYSGRPAPTFRPMFRDEEEALRIRPIAADESVARDTPLSGMGRLGWELAALAVLAIAVFPFGYLGWLLGAVLVVRSRYWEISDKVRVLAGMPAAGVGFAVLWAWLQATQIQESDNSGTRLSEAWHSFADTFAVLPQICGLLGALYLGYALVRDHHTG
ncbi:hypothetical protein GCM10009547_15450 [Sporichthya brevicatena]|uniref:Uncharacterized protein n=1 Tax=Sporichthya brevicatena TaxID=171442 RepID=A0ABP3RQU7_9ACTN